MVASTGSITAYFRPMSWPTSWFHISRWRQNTPVWLECFRLPSIEEEAVRVGSDPSDRSVAANVLLRQEPDEEEEEEEDDGEEGGDDYDKDNDGYSIRKLPIPNPLSGIQEVQSLQGFHFRSGLSSRDQAVATHPRDGGRRVVPTPELRPHLYPARHLFY